MGETEARGGSWGRLVVLPPQDTSVPSSPTEGGHPVALGDDSFQHFQWLKIIGITFLHSQNPSSAKQKNWYSTPKFLPNFGRNTHEEI